MKVLVTGATGFIGKEIVSELGKSRFEVIEIAGPKSRDQNIVSENTSKQYFADITDYKNLSKVEEITKEADAVIHSAGLAHQFGDTKKEAFEAVNVNGTRNITDLAVSLRAKHFILISSTAVYGLKKTFSKNDNRQISDLKIDENSDLNPQTLYAESKLEAEDVCREICEENNIPLTILRLAPVIGEANVGNVSRLIGAIDKNRFVWIGKGENLKSLIYKTDVARACVELIKNKTDRTEIFNLAAQPILLRDFVNEIAGQLNKKIYGFSIPEFFPRFFFRVNSKFLGVKKLDKINNTIEKWLSDDVYSAEKIAVKYGFKPEISITEAVARQVGWYQRSKSEK